MLETSRTTLDLTGNIYKHFSYFSPTMEDADKTYGSLT